MITEIVGTQKIANGRFLSRDLISPPDEDPDRRIRCLMSSTSQLRLAEKQADFLLTTASYAARLPRGQTQEPERTADTGQSGSMALPANVTKPP